MNVYVETNFVLELALLQEQHSACEDIVCAAQAGTLRLCVPTFALVEPHDTLIRRRKGREDLKRRLDQQLKQLARSSSYRLRASEVGFQNLLLVESAQEELGRLQTTRSRLLNHAVLLPLTAATVRRAGQGEQVHGLSLPDAVVFASVLEHLDATKPTQSCFINRNSKDFNDPDMVEEFSSRGCKMLYSFDVGRDFLLRVTPDP